MISPKAERLDKILSNFGIGTRKEVKRVIHSGAVTVNGNPVKDESLHVLMGVDKVCVDGEEIDIPQDVYFMMNKPADYVCSMVSDSHHILFELIKDEDKNRKYPGGDLNMVGRLDLDTEGLLILTSDGDLNHRLTSPKWNIPKKYYVTLRDNVDSQNQKRYIEKCNQGMTLPPEGKHDEEEAKPCVLEWIDENHACLTVTEGKFHEVKRIFVALGNEVIYLKRLSINGLSLDENLKSGEYRKLTETELSVLDVE